MDCEYSHLLSPYADGELDADGRERVERHVETCAACRDELEAYAALGARVAAYESDEDPFAHRRALAAVLDRARRPRLSRRVSLPAPALPALALAVAAAAFLAGRGLAPAPPPPASPPAAGAPGLARFDRGGRVEVVVVPNEGAPARRDR